MKVAVSIPDSVFERAEAYASRNGLARSKVYALALEEYVERYSEGEITRAANELADILAADPEVAAEVAMVTRGGARTVLKYTGW